MYCYVLLDCVYIIDGNKDKWKNRFSIRQQA